jgi:LmbE family N-acetylglucosaminyl deacetylase
VRTPGPTADLDAPSSALVVVAHPDDAEFQVGATLAKWSRTGAIVHHLVLTDGSKGTWDASADLRELVERRRDEQRAAAAALGATGEVVHLGEVDGELVADTRMRGRVAEAIRRLRPAVVLGHDPWKRYRLHPDHRRAGQLCVDGIVAARDPFFHPELLAAGLEPHRPSALLLFEPDQVNHVETVDDDDLAAKLAALEAHESQMETTHFYRVGEGDPLEEFRARERRRLEDAAEAVGLTGMVEPYHLIVDQL